MDNSIGVEWFNSGLEEFRWVPRGAGNNRKGIAETGLTVSIGTGIARKRDYSPRGQSQREGRHRMGAKKSSKGLKKAKKIQPTKPLQLPR